MSTNQETFDTPGTKLVTRTTCQVGEVKDEWDTDLIDCGDEIEDAIEAVRDDHCEEVLIPTDSIWVLKVYWNDNTDSVWVGRFSYHGGMEVAE